MYSLILQVLDSSKRLGCDQMGGYDSLKEHVFFEDIEWDTIPDQTPPKLMPYLPSNTKGEQGLRSEINVSVGYRDGVISYTFISDLDQPPYLDRVRCSFFFFFFRGLSL